MGAHIWAVARARTRIEPKSNVLHAVPCALLLHVRATLTLHRDCAPTRHVANHTLYVLPAHSHIRGRIVGDAATCARDKKRPTHDT